MAAEEEGGGGGLGAAGLAELISAREEAYDFSSIDDDGAAIFQQEARNRLHKNGFIIVKLYDDTNNGANDISQYILRHLIDHIKDETFQNLFKRREGVPETAGQQPFQLLKHFFEVTKRYEPLDKAKEAKRLEAEAAAEAAEADALAGPAKRAPPLISRNIWNNLTMANILRRGKKWKDHTDEPKTPGKQEFEAKLDAVLAKHHVGECIYSSEGDDGAAEETIAKANIVAYDHKIPQRDFIGESMVPVCQVNPNLYDWKEEDYVCHAAGTSFPFICVFQSHTREWVHHLKTLIQTDDKDVNTKTKLEDPNATVRLPLGSKSGFDPTKIIRNQIACNVPAGYAVIRHRALSITPPHIIVDYFAQRHIWLCTFDLRRERIARVARPLPAGDASPTAAVAGPSRPATAAGPSRPAAATAGPSRAPRAAGPSRRATKRPHEDAAGGGSLTSQEYDRAKLDKTTYVIQPTPPGSHMGARLSGIPSLHSADHLRLVDTAEQAMRKAHDMPEGPKKDVAMLRAEMLQDMNRQIMSDAFRHRPAPAPGGDGGY